MLGIVILKAHWSLMMLFFCSLELGTLSSHSGYNVPGNFAALKHDWHHCAPLLLASQEDGKLTGGDRFLH